MRFADLTAGAPCTLPLSPEQFSRALHTGHGRALQHARSHGLTGMTHSFTAACLRNPCYDAQCEGSRVRWLMQIADAAGLGLDWFADMLPTLDHVYTAEGQRYEHQDELLLLLAKRGLAAAGDLLRRRSFSGNVEDDESAYDAAYWLARLDGPAGLVPVAAAIGQALRANPAQRVEDITRHTYGEDADRNAYLSALREAALTNAEIALYLATIERQATERQAARKAARSSRQQGASRRNRNPLLQISGREIVDDIRGVQPSGISPGYWGRHAPVEEVRIVLEAAFAETDPKRLARGLSVVCDRQLPEFEPRLLPYVEHDDPMVRFRAAQALQHYREPRIRASALARIGTSELDDHCLLLFVGNYEAGDQALLVPAVETALTRRPGDEERHGVLSDVLDVLARNDDPGAASLALAVYECSPCSSCRRRAVNWLEHTKTTPDWVREEYKSDCNMFEAE